MICFCLFYFSFLWYYYFNCLILRAVYTPLDNHYGGIFEQFFNFVKNIYEGLGASNSSSDMLSGMLVALLSPLVLITEIISLILQNTVDGNDLWQGLGVVDRDTDLHKWSTAGLKIRQLSAWNLSNNFLTHSYLYAIYVCFSMCIPCVLITFIKHYIIALLYTISTGICYNIPHIIYY